MRALPPDLLTPFLLRAGIGRTCFLADGPRQRIALLSATSVRNELHVYVCRGSAAQLISIHKSFNGRKPAKGRCACAARTLHVGLMFVRQVSTTTTARWRTAPGRVEAGAGMHVYPGGKQRLKDHQLPFGGFLSHDAYP